MQNSNFQNFSNFNSQPLWAMGNRQEDRMDSQNNMNNPWVKAANSKRSSSPRPLFDNIYQNVTDGRVRSVPDPPPAPIISNLGQIGGMIGGSERFNMDMRMSQNNQNMLANMGSGMTDSSNMQNMVFNSPTNMMMGMVGTPMPGMSIDAGMMMNNVVASPWSGFGGQSPQPLMKDPPWSKTQSHEPDLRQGLNRSRSKGAIRSRGRSPKRRSPVRRSPHKSPTQRPMWPSKSSNLARSSLKRSLNDRPASSRLGRLSSRAKSPPRKRPNVPASNVASVSSVTSSTKVASNQTRADPAVIAKRRRRNEARKRNAQMRRALLQSLEESRANSTRCSNEGDDHLKDERKSHSNEDDTKKAQSNESDGRSSQHKKEDDGKPPITLKINLSKISNTEKKINDTSQELEDSKKDKDLPVEETDSFSKRNKSFLVDDEENMYGINPVHKSDDERSYFSDDEGDEANAGYSSDDMIIVDEDGEDEEESNKDNSEESPVEDNKKLEKTSSTPVKDANTDKPGQADSKDGLLLWTEEKEEISERDWQEERKSIDIFSEKVKYHIKSEDTNESKGSSKAPVSSSNTNSDRPQVTAPDKTKESDNQAKEKVVDGKSIAESNILKKLCELEFNQHIDTFPFSESDRLQIKTEIGKIVLNSNLRRQLPSGLDLLKWPKVHDQLRVNIIFRSHRAITQKQGTAITSQLLEKLRGVRLSYTGPQFTSMNMKKGNIHVVGENLESLIWLDSAARELDIDGNSLAVVDACEIESKRFTLQIIVTGPLRTAPVDEIFSRLSEQNLSINSGSWIYLGRRMLQDKQIIAVAVGEMTARTVYASNMALHIGFRKITVLINGLLDDEIFSQFIQFLKYPDSIKCNPQLSDDEKKDD